MGISSIYIYFATYRQRTPVPANDIYNNMSISNNGFHHPVCSKYVTMYICSRISVHLEQIHVIEEENYVIIIIGIHEPQIGRVVMHSDEEYFFNVFLVIFSNFCNVTLKVR